MDLKRGVIVLGTDNLREWSTLYSMQWIWVGRAAVPRIL